MMSGVIEPVMILVKKEIQETDIEEESSIPEWMRWGEKKYFHELHEGDIFRVMDGAEPKKQEWEAQCCAKEIPIKNVPGCYTLGAKVVDSPDQKRSGLLLACGGYLFQEDLDLSSLLDMENMSEVQV